MVTYKDGLYHTSCVIYKLALLQVRPVEAPLSFFCPFEASAYGLFESYIPPSAVSQMETFVSSHYQVHAHPGKLSLYSENGDYKPMGIYYFSHFGSKT